jgi:hypothetical protein
MIDYVYLSRIPTPGSLRIEKKLLEELLARAENPRTRNDKPLTIQAVCRESAPDGG